MTLIIASLSIICMTLTMSQSNLVPSLGELKILKEEIIELYTTTSLGEPLVFLPVAGSVLRLIFHDCGGPPEGNENGIISKCDACIEADNFPDHANLHNKAIDPLDDIYLGPNEWNTKMSRSDFWAFAATVAILITRDEASDNDQLPDIPYFFGREDCSTSPDLDGDITTVKQFPSAIFGWQESFNWLNANFGFNVEETVAILGAHTIGRTHIADSGFTGPWVAPWGTFDNFYYQKILNGNWRQRTANNGLKEWSESDNGFFIMLNADIALFKDLDNHNGDGSVSCGSNINFCTDNQVTINFIEAFANNNQLWLNAFVPAYIKMITAGYNINDMTQRSDNDIENGVTMEPTEIATDTPTESPTKRPSSNPSESPTTKRPTLNPLNFVTSNPVQSPTADPTKAPSVPTANPLHFVFTGDPTDSPTQAPTLRADISTTVDGCDFDIDAYLERCYCSDTMNGLNLGSAHNVGINKINDYIDYNLSDIIDDDLIMYLNVLMPTLTLMYLIYIGKRGKRVHKYAHVAIERDTEQSIINQ